MLYAGIRNSMEGGIVIIDDGGNIVEKVPMPVVRKPQPQYDIFKIYKFFYKYHMKRKDIMIVVEKPAILPVTGRRVAYSIGVGSGIIQTILTVLNLEFSNVTPQEWTNGLSLKDKNERLAWVFKRYPQDNWTTGDKSRTICIGMTDACGIAHYAKLLYKGELQNGLEKDMGF